MVSTISGTPARGDVTVYRATGVHKVFNGESQTAEERGNALLAALSYAQDQSVVVLSNNTFYIGNNGIDLSLGGTGTVHLYGSGKHATLIQSDVSIGVLGDATSVIHPGLTNCVVRDLAVESLNTSNISPHPSQACWGCTSTETAFTNAQLHDCYLIGRSDAIYIKNGSACTARIRDVDATSSFDAFALLSGSGSHVVEVWNSTFVSRGSGQPDYSALGTVRGASVSGTGAVRFYSCDFQAIGSTEITVACTALNVSGSNAAVKAYNCRYYATNTGTANAIGARVLTQASASLTCIGGDCETSATGGGSAYDVSQATGTLRVVGLSYDDAKQSGSPTFGLWNGVSPTTSGLNTLST